jgi:hypothetical protein
MWTGGVLFEEDMPKLRRGAPWKTAGSRGLQLAGTNATKSSTEDFDERTIAPRSGLLSSSFFFHCAGH